MNYCYNPEFDTTVTRFRDDDTCYTYRDCAVCCDTPNTPCNKCLLKNQMNQILFYKARLMEYENDKEELLVLPQYDKMNLRRIKRSVKPIPFKFPDDPTIVHYRFITITFDPKKFGTSPLEELRKNYILDKLYKSVESDKLVEKFYGSFEYHKNGMLHAHAILVIHSVSDKVMARYFTDFFSDNPRNKVAIQLGPAKKQAIDYINKESDDYFYYSRSYKECSTTSDIKMVDDDLDNIMPDIMAPPNL